MTVASAQISSSKGVEKINFRRWIANHEQIIVLSFLTTTLVASMILIGTSVYFWGKMIQVPNYAIIQSPSSVCYRTLNINGLGYSCTASNGAVYPVDVPKIMALGERFWSYLGYAIFSGVLSILSVSFLRSGVFQGQSLAMTVFERLNRPKPSNGFSPQLSGLRGVASLGVGIYHLGGYIPLFLTGIVGTFFFGVPIFFMLSMFLLLTTLEKKLDLRHYFKRRILRIWPIYYGAIFIFYFSGRFGISTSLFLTYLPFLTVFLHAPAVEVTSIFWTLQVEEFAYLAIPFISMLTLRGKRLLGLVLILTGSYFLFVYTIPNIQFLQGSFLPISLIPYGLGILVYTIDLFSELRFLALIGSAALALQFQGLVNPPAQVTSLFYLLALIGFAVIVQKPPRFLSLSTIMGESSYAFYAIHRAFEITFGPEGILFALPVAFVVEFSLRSKQILERLRLVYRRTKI